MIIKSDQIILLKYNAKIKDAIEQLKENKYSVIPILDDSQKYLGAFDKNSIAKIIYQNISINDSVEKVYNKNFPTILEENVMKYCDIKTNSYIIALNSNKKVVGIVDPSRDKDCFELLNNPFFDQLLNSISDGVLICDKNSIVKKVNRAYTELTGVTSNEIEGVEVGKIRKGAQIPRSINSGKVMKNIYRKEDNTEYFVDLYPIKMNDRVQGGIAIAKNITEVRNLTKKVNEWENKFCKLKRSINEHHRAKKSFEQIVTVNKKLKGYIELAKKVSSSDSNILIRGESGTGKEIFAQAIHNYSYRNNNPFVAINAAAIEPNLILSELFGYEDGAFTGAVKGGKMGLFEIAHKGTLFLDEIGDLDFELQSKLLRVLENNEITRVGGYKNIKVDVRIISATNVDLEEKMKDKKFRSDLYFRLNVIPIVLPPLRERKEDIPHLVDHILCNLEQQFSKKIYIKDEVIDTFLRYKWPGNIRELQNILIFATSMMEENTITIDHIPPRVLQDIKEEYHIHYSKSGGSKSTDVGADNLASIKLCSEKNKIIKALRKYGKSVEGKKQAASSLGVSLSTLYSKINQYNLKKEV